MPSSINRYASVIPLVILLHLWVAPYTKVEESFNIQAIHDFLKYGIPVNGSALKIKFLFDHMTFSGSVPRTFVGAISVAGLSKPVIWIGSLQGLLAQVTVRAVLGLLNAIALVAYIESVRRAYGSRTAMWYTFIQTSQFHVFFYASRPLPNMFAFCLSTFASSLFLPDPTSSASKRHQSLRRAFYLLTFAAVIFRSELALLVASHAGWEMLKSGSINNAYILVRRFVIPSVFTAGLASILISVPLDTYFWQSDQWLLPELSAFLFNIFPKNHEGASAWGTSPWHWYITSAIPRLVLNPGLLLLIPYGILSTTQRPQILDTIIPSLGYTAIYSILPHKETRFLFPIIPPLTLATAIPASYLSLRRDSISKILTRTLILTTALATLISHTVLLPLSNQSYPGGRALQRLHAYHATHSPKTSIDASIINVHLTNFALQSGITRFLEQPDPTRKTRWSYDKSATPAFASNASSLDVDLTIEFWSQFTYAIVEPENPFPYPYTYSVSSPPPNSPLSSTPPSPNWIPLFTVPSLQRTHPQILNPTTARGCLVLCRPGQPTKTDEDSLYSLLREMYGRPIAMLYGVVHDVVREGYGVPRGRSLSRGYWVDWGLEGRLAVLGNTARMSEME